MTLNQIIKRIKAICLAHKQIRSFYRGFSQDFLTSQTTRFPAVFLEDGSGTINTAGKAATFNYRLSFFDLVNVSEDTKTNEQDVDSDMVSVAMDVLSQLNYGAWDDWSIGTENPIQLIISEANGDMYGGCIIDISVRVMFKQNICSIPSEVFQQAGEEDLQIVYDLVYTSDGTEGSTLSIPTLSGKKILFVKRGDTPIYKVSNSPTADEFTWNGQLIGLGSSVNTAERFLILYSGNL